MQTRVDNTAPTGTDVQASNGGATAGKVESGDAIIYTFSEEMAPASVLSGWSGGGSQAVRLRVKQNGTTDLVQVETTGGASVGLGSVNTRRDFVGADAVFNATLSRSGNGTQ